MTVKEIDRVVKDKEFWFPVSVTTEKEAPKHIMRDMKRKRVRHKVVTSNRVITTNGIEETVEFFQILRQFTPKELKDWDRVKHTESIGEFHQGIKLSGDAALLLFFVGIARSERKI